MVLSIRAYARQRGVNHVAVLRAIKQGRVHGAGVRRRDDFDYWVLICRYKIEIGGQPKLAASQRTIRDQWIHRLLLFRGSSARRSKEQVVADSI
jgi:hypothetical protein